MLVVGIVEQGLPQTRELRSHFRQLRWKALSIKNAPPWDADLTIRTGINCQIIQQIYQSGKDNG